MGVVKKILILAANPIDTARIRLEKEVREIQDVLKRASGRENFVLNYKLAVRLKDLRRALLDYEPDIVHFCGHGEKNGIVLEDDNGRSVLVKPDALGELFELFSSKTECVLLNACFTRVQANAINQHIKFVVGMRKEITDDAAIEFAVGFYDGLGAGRTIEESFKFGLNATRSAGIPESMLPILMKAPKRILFIEDQPNWQTAIQNLIEKSPLRKDFVFHTAVSFLQAETMLRKSYYDLLIINLCLIDDNDFLGEELLYQIKENSKKYIPCIVLTGKSLEMVSFRERYKEIVKAIFSKGSKENIGGFSEQMFLSIINSL